MYQIRLDFFENQWVDNLRCDLLPEAYNELLGEFMMARD